MEASETAQEAKTARRSRLHPYQKRTLQRYAAVLVVIALPLAGFVAGMHYQQGKAPKAMAAGSAVDSNNTGRPFGGNGQRFRGRLNLGTVSAISSTSITVKLTSDGSSKTYAITSDTTVMNGRQTASTQDIKVDDTVAVIPDANDSTTAARILINPSFPGFGGGPQSGQQSL